MKDLEDLFIENQYNKMEIKTREMDNKNPLRILLDASFQGVKRSFILACNSNTVNDNNNPINNTNNRVQRDSHQKYFLLRVNMANYYILIDGRVFYDQSIGDQVKKHDEIRKTAKEQEDDYTTGCWIINTLKTTIN